MGILPKTRKMVQRSTGRDTGGEANMPMVELTHQQVFEMRKDFIAERIAIMMIDGGLPENVAVVDAEKCWKKYLKHIMKPEQRVIDF